MSIDIIGSSAIKNRCISPIHHGDSDRKDWKNEYKSFYRKAPVLITQHHDLAFIRRDSAVHGSAPKSENPIVLKVLGDEIIFYSCIEHHHQAVDLIYALRDTLRELNHSTNISFKGTAWIAGIPIINSKMEVSDGKFDFVGPSVDTGFRLASFSSKRKLVVSVDLALLLTTCSVEPTDDMLVFYFDGHEQLKGVLFGKPYPIIWVEADRDDTEEKLRGIAKNKCPRADLRDFAKKFIVGCETDSWLIRPYLMKDPLFSYIHDSQVARLGRYKEDEDLEDEKAHVIDKPPSFEPVDTGEAPISISEKIHRVIRMLDSSGVIRFTPDPPSSASTP